VCHCLSEVLDSLGNAQQAFLERIGGGKQEIEQEEAVAIAQGGALEAVLKRFTATTMEIVMAIGHIWSTSIGPMAVHYVNLA